MPVVISQHQRINYNFEGERGPFLILHPPLSYSLQVWYRLGYVEQLQSHFRVIVMDPLGQGHSDAPADGSFYNLQARADHVLALMDELMIDRGHFWGMGFGGLVGFELAKRNPERLRSLITSGAHPYAISTDLTKLQQQIEGIRSQGMAEYVRALKSETDISTEQEADILRHSPDPCAWTLEALCKWEGVGDKLSAMRMSALLFTATTEERFLAVREAGRTMPHGRYVILSQLKYIDGILDPELVIPPVLEFIKKQRW